MSARLYLHVLVVLRTDLTQLEGGAHLTVELVLFLRAWTTHKGFQYLHTEQHHSLLRQDVIALDKDTDGPSLRCPSGECGDGMTHLIASVLE